MGWCVLCQSDAFLDRNEDGEICRNHDCNPALRFERARAKALGLADKLPPPFDTNDEDEPDAFAEEDRMKQAKVCGCGHNSSEHRKSPRNCLICDCVEFRRVKNKALVYA
jgi:hypothetical protein